MNANKRNKFDYYRGQYHDKEAVCDYLISSFSRRQAQKKKGIYKSLVRLYSEYPETVTQIIDQLPKLGYWKDYLFLLQYSNNEELTEYIYHILHTQLLEDIENDKNGLPISTLAKWLPRQSSSFDRKIQFIDEFNKIMYPGVERNSARRRYRQLLSRLTSKLSVPEVKLCAKEYDQINFESIGPISYYRNLKQFEKNCPEKLEEHLFEQYLTYRLWKFCNKICKRTLSDTEKLAVEKAWLNNNEEYTNQLKFLNFPNSKILIDLSQEVYDNYLHLIVAVVLASDKPVFMNAKNPIKIEFESDKILDRIEQLKASMAYYKTIQYEKLVEDENTRLIILTDRKVPNFVIHFDRIIWWQFTPEKISVSENKIVGSPYIKRDPVYNLRLITEIVENSDELRDIYAVNKYWIGGLFLLLVFFFSYYYFA